MTLSDYQTHVDSLVRDRDDVVSTDQRDAAIAAAVRAYSIAQPRSVVVDVTGAGSCRIGLPQGFTEDSRLRRVEYPIGFVPTRYVELAEVSIYRSPTERQIQLPMAIAIGDTVRITYTSTHVLDATDDTIPDRHAYAVQCLAASMLCGQLASYYAGDSEPTISADTVDHQSKSQFWRRRHDDLMAEYTRAVGKTPDPRKQPASATTPLPHGNALGHANLFHPTRHWRG